MLCSWAKHFTLTVLLLTQEYKCLPANCGGGGGGVTCDGLKYFSRSHFYLRCGRRGGLVVSALDPDREVRVRTLAGSLFCVLGQNTLLSQCFSSPRSTIVYLRTVAGGGGVICDGLKYFSRSNFYLRCGRLGSLVVSVLDSGLRGPGSTLAWSL